VCGQPYDLDELEHKLSELETELLEVNSNQDKLSRSHSELVELQLVLEKAGGFFEEAMRDVGSIEDELRAREQVRAAHARLSIVLYIHPEKLGRRPHACLRFQEV
jgi:hypothetical protein